MFDFQFIILAAFQVYDYQCIWLLQGAIEALEYYNPPEEGTVDNLSDSPPEKTTED